MIQKIIEFSDESVNKDGQDARSNVRIEVLISLDVYTELKDILNQLKYPVNAGQNTEKIIHKFIKLIQPYIVLERDRLWFLKHIKNKFLYLEKISLVDDEF